jgi:hypothetical protein
MGNYAKVVDGIVTKIIVADSSFFDSFVDDSPGEWLQTSYNTKGGVYYKPNTTEPDADQTKAFRKNFAGIGFSYNKLLDAFIPPKPFPSWVLNDDTCLWIAPVAMPVDGMVYWDESLLNWVAIENV